LARRPRLLSTLVVAIAIGALPAAAQAPPSASDRLVLPTPSAPGSSTPDWAAVGAPPEFDPNASARMGQEPLIDCGRDLPCRVRLRGVLGKNGAVAVEGTAFTW
jgi:hypothetical protein